VKDCDSANKVMLRLMSEGTRNGAGDVLAERLTAPSLAYFHCWRESADR
jgi:hypothetical protein